jgi:DHA2 family methylenomycin A resistance protein-like MFS transporter
VLHAVALALQLDEAERLHLFDLARAARPAKALRRRTAPVVRPNILRMLDEMTGMPAFVRNGRLDVLATTMLPASMALIREAFPDSRRRARALGIWAVGGAVAGAVGPLLGGALTTIDWRLVFAINLPVCAAMLILLRRIAQSPRRANPFDWAGQILAIIALAGLIFGLIHGGTAGFGAPSVVLSLVGAAVGIAAFLLGQGRSSHPMMPLPLFRSTGIRIALSVGFAFMAGNFGSVFFVSLFLQQHLGLTPLVAGLVFLPSAAFSVLGNVMSGRLRNHFGPRAPAVTGQLSMVVGFAARPGCGPHRRNADRRRSGPC